MAGSTECTNCTKGSFASSAGSSACGQSRGRAGCGREDNITTTAISPPQPCPSPPHHRQTHYRYSLAIIQPIFTAACNEGYYASEVGSSTCLKCTSEIGPSYDSSPGSAECDKCLRDSYRIGEKCAAKPAGVIVGDESGTVSWEPTNISTLYM